MTLSQRLAAPYFFLLFAIKSWLSYSMSPLSIRCRLTTWPYIIQMDFLFYYKTPQWQGSSIRRRSRTAGPGRMLSRLLLFSRSAGLSAPAPKVCRTLWQLVCFEIPPKESNCTSSLENLFHDWQTLLTTRGTRAFSTYLVKGRNKLWFGLVWFYFTLSRTLDDIMTLLT